MIFFAHNIVSLLRHRDHLPKPWSWAICQSGAGAIFLNCVWVSLCFCYPGDRHRDIGPFSVVQLLFFMTPIIWNDETLRRQWGAGRRSSIAELNLPLHHSHRAGATVGRSPGSRGAGWWCWC